MKRALQAMAVIALLQNAPTQAAEAITYKYDVRGRLVEVKRTGTVNNNVKTTYTHDKANNRKTLTTTGSSNTTSP